MVEWTLSVSVTTKKEIAGVLIDHVVIVLGEEFNNKEVALRVLPFKANRIRGLGGHKIGIRLIFSQWTGAAEMTVPFELTRVRRSSTTAKVRIEKEDYDKKIAPLLKTFKVKLL